MLHSVVAAAFQQIAEARQVGIDVGSGILQAVAHSGLGRQIDHVAETPAPEKFGHAPAVGQVQKLEAKAGGGLGQGLQGGQPVLFQLHVIVVVAIVDAYHSVPVSQQPPGQMIADEAGSAGYQNMHVAPFACTP